MGTKASSTASPDVVIRVSYTSGLRVFNKRSAWARRRGQAQVGWRNRNNACKSCSQDTSGMKAGFASHKLYVTCGRGTGGGGSGCIQLPTEHRGKQTGGSLTITPHKYASRDGFVQSDSN